MANYFGACDILLPKASSYEKWAVIACDQHTSEPQYWEHVRETISNAPSTLDMFFPESELGEVSDKLLTQYSDNMRKYLNQDFFKEYANSYVYVERTLKNGKIRCGILGVIDLEFYDYKPKSTTKILATEATVLQRVPPRIALRKIADLEFSHTVIFCDDPTCNLIDPITAMRTDMEKLYDFDLMTDGGHITGYLLSEELAHSFNKAIALYEKENSYLVGDGNHSLVTAKLTYEALKECNPEVNWVNHPARYAMVELENIHSDAMVFEPIYRIAVCDNPDAMIQKLQGLNVADGMPITWIRGEEEGTVYLAVAEGELPIEALQRFLDHWTEEHAVAVDYIHGQNTVRKLAQEPGTVGFIVPAFDKSVLFPYILSGKVMPKKTFSIGQAEEKRYYLEGRRIR